MLDGGISKSSSEDSGVKLPKKVNECIIAVQRTAPPAKLFDAFWTEGEMAFLFGPTGLGKSVLAVEIADAIARGRRIDGFEMTAKRQRVLYVDLRLTEGQFGAKYIKRDENGDSASYKFSENMYIDCDCPASTEKLIARLRKTVSKLGIRTIVIDDLSAVRTNGEGVREMLRTLRELDRLKRELGLSILVLLGSREPGWGRDVSESDLLRSRVLCDVADSVFAMGRQAHVPSDAYLIQTRLRSGKIRWTVANAPGCRVQRFDSGLLGFMFDPRFTPKIDDETRAEICLVRTRRDAGLSYRQIAAATAMGLATVHKLNKMWTSELAEEERKFCAENDYVYGAFVDEDNNVIVSGDDHPEQNKADAAHPAPEQAFPHGENGAAPNAPATPYIQPPHDPADETDEEVIASLCAQFPREEEEFGDFEMKDPAADGQGVADDATPDPGAPLLTKEGLMPPRQTEWFSDDEVANATEVVEEPFDPLANLTPTINAYGREIFVQLSNAKGKPIVWYEPMKNGQFKRWEQTEGRGH